jgi:hypothetical protein
MLVMTPIRFSLEAYIGHQITWSSATFGTTPRTNGLCDHIEKELKEIKAAPHDLSEWVDVAILALDGAWRAGFTPAQIVAALMAKQAKNIAREWPPLAEQDPDKAAEHDRSKDAPHVFKVGDWVRIARKVDHCFFSWVPAMDALIGSIGRVVDIGAGDEAETYLVRVGDDGAWTYDSKALDRVLP